MVEEIETVETKNNTPVKLLTMSSVSLDDDGKATSINIFSKSKPHMLGVYTADTVSIILDILLCSLHNLVCDSAAD
jgi:hypothetical protein